MRNDYTDYIQHALFSKKHKYVAKVKYGTGSAARYFYNNDDYQAYLKNKNAKVTVNAPASVTANHKLNQAKLKAKNVGSTLSKTAANVGEKISNLTSTVKAKTSSAKNTFINGRPAGIHQKPTRGAAGAAYTASRKTSDAMKSIQESYRKVAGDKNYGNGGLHPGSARKAIWNAKSKLGIAKANAKKLYNNSVKPKAQKAWTKAGVEYHKDLKIAQHTANAVKNYATQKASEAKMYAQHEMGRQKKAYNAKSKNIGHELSEMMNYHLNKHGDSWNEDFAKSLERKVVNTIANKNLSASEKALWISKATKMARQNGLKISAKRLAKLAATKF